MKPLRLFTFHLVCLTVSLPFLSTLTQAEDTLKTTQARTQPLQGARDIQFVNDQLTVNVKDMSLHELLQEVARQSGLTLVPYVSLEDRITVEFHQLSLEEGLRRILRHQSFAVEYSYTPEKSPSTVPPPKTLWIFPKGEEDHVVKGDDPWEREEAVEALGETGRPEAVAPLSLALADEDEDVREAAIAALANIGGDAAAQALAIALQDEDATIREEAVEALANIGGDAAAQALAIALQDQDSSVREGAVETLGEIGGERAIRLLEQALTDEDESVRDTAADMLEQLRSQSR